MTRPADALIDMTKRLFFLFLSLIQKHIWPVATRSTSIYQRDTSIDVLDISRSQDRDRDAGGEFWGILPPLNPIRTKSGSRAHLNFSSLNV